VKIVIAHGTPVNRISGFCIAVKNLYKGLQNLGHDVAFVCPSREDARTTAYSYKSPLGIWPIPNIIDKHVYKKIKKFQPDIVHNHDLGVVGIAVIKYAYDLNLPIVLTIHSEFRELLKSSIPSLLKFFLTPVLVKYLKRYINLCDIVIAPTENIKAYLEREGVKTKIVVQPSGIDLSIFSYKPRMHKVKNYKLLSVGSLVKGKNFPCLIKMMTYLNNEKYSLDIIGGGRQMKRLKDLIDRLELKNVKLHGSIRNSHMGRYYRNADLFLSSSITESQGLVYIEAMASGLPIVSLRNLGSKNIVKENESGILVSRDNPKLFADKVKYLMSDPELYSKYSKNAYERSRRYDIRKTAKETVEIYEDLIEIYKKDARYKND